MTKVFGLIEKYGPLLLSLLSGGLLYGFKINWVENTELNSIIETTMTASSIFIGLIGTFIPTLTTMKSESKYVRVILEVGGSTLKKYCLCCISSGIWFILMSLLLMFKDSYKGSWLYNYVFYLWSFFWLIIFALHCQGILFHYQNNVVP